MTNHILNTCTCPLCKKAGQSVAAMRYAETRHWNKPEDDSGLGPFEAAFAIIIAFVFVVIDSVGYDMIIEKNLQVMAFLLLAFTLMTVIVSFLEAFENQKQVRRYNQLHYCKNCHLLFDSQGRSADGGEFGFSQMMAYD